MLGNRCYVVSYPFFRQKGLVHFESSLYSTLKETIEKMMLNLSDLIDRESLPQEQEISLELPMNFYEQYLCTRVFVFTLEDDAEVKIIFMRARL